jgi:hypothetical protein
VTEPEAGIGSKSTPDSWKHSGPIAPTAATSKHKSGMSLGFVGECARTGTLSAHRSSSSNTGPQLRKPSRGPDGIVYTPRQRVSRAVIAVPSDCAMLRGQSAAVVSPGWGLRTVSRGVAFSTKA